MFFYYIFVFVSMTSFSLAWVCDYWIADPKGKIMNQVIADRLLGWSLHGAWNEKGNSTECLGYEQFLVIMHEKFVRGELVHFIDSSPKTQHTCCRGQWHEYKKHGCEAGISFDAWWQAIKNCTFEFNPSNESIHSCRFDQAEECNFPEEVTNKNLSKTIGCKEDYPTCNYFCNEYTNVKVCDFYYDIDGKSHREAKFLVPNVFSPDVRGECPNCFCQVNQRNRRWYNNLPYEITHSTYENIKSVKNEKKNRI